MPASDVAPDRLVWSDVQAYFRPGQANRQVVALPEQSLVYVKNPKSGSSTLMLWLHRLHTGDPTSTPGRVHRESGLPRVHEVGRRRVVAMLAGDAFRFSFVRDPVRRLESVYWAKMFRDWRFRARIADELGISPDPSVHVPFEQFLESVERQDPLTEMDLHWRPQHLNLLHPLITLDEVGRLESFDADLARIVERAGLPAVPAEPHNTRPQHQQADSVYQGRPDLRTRVERLYARDMELYGY